MGTQLKKLLQYGLFQAWSAVVSTSLILTVFSAIIGITRALLLPCEPSKKILKTSVRQEEKRTIWPNAPSSEKWAPLLLSTFVGLNESFTARLLLRVRSRSFT